MDVSAIDVSPMVESGAPVSSSGPESTCPSAASDFASPLPPSTGVTVERLPQPQTSATIVHASPQNLILLSIVYPSRRTPPIGAREDVIPKPVAIHNSRRRPWRETPAGPFETTPSPTASHALEGAQPPNSPPGQRLPLARTEFVIKPVHEPHARKS